MLVTFAVMRRQSHQGPRLPGARPPALRAFPRVPPSVRQRGHGILFVLLMMALGPPARAKGLETVRFMVVDPATNRPVAGAVTVEEVGGDHHTATLTTGLLAPAPTLAYNLRDWRYDLDERVAPTLITIPAGTAVTLQAPSQPPIRDIYIRVTASRIQLRQSQTSSGTTLNQQELNTFVNRTSNNATQLTQGQKGVASDSAGQQHIRGEHAEIAYVVDGIPLPDTLSGRQVSVVVPATIQSLDILTGAYAPEFGGQTAAILDITTLPGATRAHEDVALQGGSYDTYNGTATAMGPLGKRASYVLNVGADTTRNALEPQQPDNQTAHNAGSDLNFFAAVRANPSRRDRVTLTLSRAPATLQIGNRTGLPESFAPVGQGFGFLGLRDADGTRPDVTPDNAGTLGAQPMVLPSQDLEGMDITQREVNEFAVLSWRRQLSSRDVGLFSVTLLHSGQDIHNNNPAVDVLNLPVDNSIEFNPTATRNAHHVQFTGSYTAPRGHHTFKTGILWDDQSGDETYQIVPASRLALDELAALSPNLAPAGATQTGANGNPVVDVDGNPVYVPTSGISPVVRVHRSGWYRAAYAQDTWQPSHHFTFNYGVRADWYRQALNLGQPPVDTIHVTPRLNFSYGIDRLTVLKWSYDRILDTPPLAQGAIVGETIQPELINQYEVDLQRQMARNQILSLAYYYKQIKEQVDTGLLVPGSEIGLFSSVNFQFGAVHGIEVGYDIYPNHGIGWDSYVNYTWSTAKPNGKDNTGAPAPDFNDHDQRNSVGVGLAYLFKGGASAAMQVNYGSGLASSIVTPNGPRTPRTEVDLRLSSGPRIFGRHGGIGLDVDNLFDERSVINFQSGFSGTRFMQGRRILFSVFGNF